MTFYVTKITFLFGHGHILCCYYDFSCDQDCFFFLEGGGQDIFLCDQDDVLFGQYLFSCGQMWFYVTKKTFLRGLDDFTWAR